MRASDPLTGIMVLLMVNEAVPPSDTKATGASCPVNKYSEVLPIRLYEVHEPAPVTGTAKTVGLVTVV
ncbi:hypothetical protein COLO4_02664 [Corchorus olitorius]|uniref:Uncharacterized protein n=1 Tax=Corchorus olitorius TaxID=93759 RepID=A0A1R3L0I4_9ROSI|nr:hypothetical protein COLO4_02664 [Corchorus olitorius]